ncbi:MAG TPA: DNA-processing protein DprA [Polyangiaceae bacterium]|nr:DNA-processing protein DprA [Polyangiaceae bacterium]
MSQVIVRGQAGYPGRLDELRSPPAALYVRGVWPPEPGVAVVGTRKPGREAERFARELGATLARAGLTLWSGGALGIDAAAHEGALEAGGVTVLVAGGSLDAPYPACHGGLYGRVEASGGALVSLLADGLRPRRWVFLERNRVLAALTLATVVVECPLKSGARSTAAAARHLGRPVWVAAQPPWARGLALAVREEIRLGATPLFSVDDLLASLGHAPSSGRAGASGRAGEASKRAGEAAGRAGEAAGRAGEAAGQAGEAAGQAGEAVGWASPLAKGPAGEAPAGLGGRAAGEGSRRPGGGARRGRVVLPKGSEVVWQALAKAPGATHLDEICARTGLGASQVQYGLTLLLLGGWLDEGPPGQFRVRKASVQGG